MWKVIDRSFRFVNHRETTDAEKRKNSSPLHFSSLIRSNRWLTIALEEIISHFPLNHINEKRGKLKSYCFGKWLWALKIDSDRRQNSAYFRTNWLCIDLSFNEISTRNRFVSNFGQNQQLDTSGLIKNISSGNSVDYFSRPTRQWQRHAELFIGFH